MKEWILGLGGIPWKTVRRDARVFLRGTVTPFPFQANLHGHPPAMVRRCLTDFAAERIRESLAGGGRPSPNFNKWLLNRFGRTMCAEFFFPYNRKLWCASLSGIEPSWTSWSVPVPSFEELLAGARGEVREGMGYNPSFLYPARGGIGALPARLERGVRNRIRTGTELVRIDLSKKRAWSAGGEEIRFDAVISTVPLPALSSMCAPVSAAVREAAGRLRWVKVLAVNLGVRSPRSTHGHWAYVPEKRYPFYRVGFLSNVCPSAAPEGCASVCAETGFPSSAEVDVPGEVRKTLSGLRRMGVLRDGQEPEALRAELLDPAYVVYDHARGKAVETLRGHFRRRGVFTAGRYGAWVYNGMEASMADGIRAAQEALRFVGNATG
ncbi:MAG: FAD-dependent oxidoreductase [Deltaproteobacteria bacterium]|nr:FAD-dependent oxidoreductase [Deltaproteobacteria bacterium]